MNGKLAPIGVVPPQDGATLEARVRVTVRRAYAVAGREMLALSGEHDDLDRVVLGRRPDASSSE